MHIVNGIIIGTAITLQFASALVAVRFIQLTGRYRTGLMIIATILLMAVRRCVSMYRLVTVGLPKVDTVAELIGLAISLLILCGVVHIVRLTASEEKAKQEKDGLIKDLQDAVANVKALKGLLPICASCKKIRDDHGYWNQIELYIADHSDAEFSHGICPDCARVMYADLENFNKSKDT